MEDSKLLIFIDNEVAYLRVVGRGTYRLAEMLNGLNAELVKRVGAHSISSVILDMSLCDGVDSTFMGLMAKLANSVKTMPVTLAVANASPENRETLDEIGVTRRWKCITQDDVSRQWVVLEHNKDGIVQMTDNLAEIILNAHRALMDWDARNIPKFQPVVDMLEHEIKHND